MQSFTNYSWVHFAALGVIVAIVVTAIVVRRRRDHAPQPTGPVERMVGYAFLALWVGTFLWLRFGPLYDPPTTYPLQLCHLMAAAAAVSLITVHPALRAVVYFCGLGLCTQALITPVLPEGPARFPFWFFWASHGMIVGVPVYDVAARGYRPGWRDYAFACAAAVFYVLMVLPVDLIMGWNYGFVGPSSPGVPTIVDYLGPWPQRLATIFAIAAGAMFLFYLPWVLVKPARSPSARR